MGLIAHFHSMMPSGSILVKRGESCTLDVAGGGANTRGARRCELVLEWGRSSRSAQRPPDARRSSLLACSGSVSPPSSSGCATVAALANPPRSRRSAFRMLPVVSYHRRAPRPVPAWRHPGAMNPSVMASASATRAPMAGKSGGHCRRRRCAPVPPSAAPGPSAVGPNRGR